MEITVQLSEYEARLVARELEAAANREADVLRRRKERGDFHDDGITQFVAACRHLAGALEDAADVEKQA